MNWLRAKARLTRWEEELRLVPHEMDWTVNWLRKKSMGWQDLSEVAKEAHMVAYAERQAAQWNHLASQAEKAFSWVKETDKENRKRKRPPSP